MLRVLALLFAALTMAPGLAHLLELPHKISLSAQDYLVVQQIYRGWALLGIVILLALLTIAILLFRLRRDGRSFRWAAAALAAMVLTQIIFWTYTFPANQATHDWTFLPDGWQSLRTRWEYSHAVNAVLEMFAFVALSISVVRRDRR